MVAGEIDGGIAGRDKEIGADFPEFSGHFGADQVGVGFLDQVVHVGQAGKASAQIGPESGLMRLHLGGEPLGMVRGGNLAEAYWEGSHWKQVTQGSLIVTPGDADRKKHRPAQNTLRVFVRFDRGSGDPPGWTVLGVEKLLAALRAARRRDSDLSSAGPAKEETPPCIPKKGAPELGAP